MGTGIETVTELRASEERIKMQQPALRVFLFLAVVSAQPFENKNNSSSAIPFRQKRSTYHWLYCPTGEQFIAVHSSDIMYGHVMEEFEHKCQCYRDSPPYEKHKSWNTDRSDYYWFHFRTLGLWLHGDYSGECLQDPRHVLRDREKSVGLRQRIQLQFQADVRWHRC